MFGEMLREQIIERQKSRIDKQGNLQEILLESLRSFEQLMKLLRDCSVNATIVAVTYEEFKRFWKSVQVYKNANNLLFSIWRLVPYQSLQIFLGEFNLIKFYHSIPPQQFFGIISSGLFQNKIQQHCEYYRIYKKQRIFDEKQIGMLEAFEYEQIIPRITKKDQLFSDYVIELIKCDKDIARKVFQSADIRQYEKLVKMTGKSIADHPRLIHYSMMKHYKDMARRNKEWFVIEDKISFSSEFMRWFAEDILKVFKIAKKIEESDSGSDCEAKRLKYTISSQKQATQIAESILLRGKVRNQMQGSYIENPLYERDGYVPTQTILSALSGKQEKQAYLTLQFLKATQHSIYFIDELGEKFACAVSKVLKSEVVGFDSQFRATESKYQEGGVSIIQLAIKGECFIFDYYRLSQSDQFNSFFVELMQSEKIVKIGHTVSSDLHYLYKTFKRKVNIRSFVDLIHLYKKLYPQQTYSSLAFMCEKFLGRKMCKYQQRSNWNRRPLKKTQMAYASLDAWACIEIFEKILEEKKMGKEGILSEDFRVVDEAEQDKSEEVKENIKTKQEWIQPGQDFDFKKFVGYLKQPIFLVDNMLKKLCSTMRNCGLDAEFISIKDPQLAAQQSKREKRIFITRDSKLLTKRFSNVPIYLLKERGDSEIMFKEIIQVFGIDLSKYSTLSRCVKCNNRELVVISSEQAKKQINFMYEDSEIAEFWRCSQCKQIYWQGGQFKKAKSKYEQLRK